MESSERRGAISLGTLRRAAEALDCTLVYALVPNKPLEETVTVRARAIAADQLRRVNHTMRLEAQDVEADTMQEELDWLTGDILNGNLGRLWD